MRIDMKKIEPPDFSDELNQESPWQIGTPPHGIQVLAVVKQERRRGIIRAVYIGRYEEEADYSDDIYEPECDYRKEDDTYYLKEGWYEQIDYWGDICSVWVDDPVTYWMPLPEMPK